MKRKKIKGMLPGRALISKILVFVLVLSSLFVPQGTIAVYAGEEQPSGEEEQNQTMPEEGVTTPSAITATVSERPSTATQIKNGDFEEIPWESYVLSGVTYTSKPSSNPSGTITSAIPNGVGKGWNTTENSPYQGSLFEVWDVNNLPAEKNRTFEANGNYFIEMNANNPACLYQDLATQGGDVIKWTLQHAARTGLGFQEQRMYVTVGAPVIEDGKNIAATGVNNNIDTKIQDSGKVQYKYNGITTGGGITASVSEMNLSGLSVPRSDSAWHDVSGIYVVPQGQDTTRFAFCADGSSKQSGDNDKDLSGGNFLDNITFSTLIGSLKATKQSDGDVEITGYWGDTNTEKKLVVDLGQNKKYRVDMSQVCGKDFEITVPETMVEDAEKVNVYHEDYASATKEVPITHEHTWHYKSGVVDEANKIYAFCSENESESGDGTHDCTYKESAKNVSLTLTAPDAVYTGNAYNEARVSNWSVSDVSLAAKPQITYYCLNGEAVTKTDASNSGAASEGAAPKNAGKYRAEITIPNGTGSESDTSTVTAMADFTISKLKIHEVAFTEPKTTSGSVPATTLDTAANAHYTGSISWDPADEKFGYNKTYTATVTLSIKENSNCEFITGSSIKFPSGWRWQDTSTADQLVLKKDYTIKPKITAVTAPDAVMQLSELTTKENQLALLPNSVSVAVEDHSVSSMAITWELKKNTTYSTNLSAENVFVWKIEKNAYSGYDTNGKTLTGEVKIKNPSHTTHNWTYEGQENQLGAYCTLADEPGCIYDSAHKLTLTLIASDAAYTGNVYTGASISQEGQSKWTAAGLEIPTIRYKGDTGATSDTAPTAAGNYKAVISAGGQNAEAVFKITPGEGESGGDSGSGSGGSSGSGSGSSSGGGSSSESGSGSSSGGGSSSGSGSSSSGGSSSGSGSGSSESGTEPTTPAENFSIPVKNENTVKVEAEIKEGTAKVSEITNDTIDQVINSKDEQSKVDTITIDLSGAKQEVTGVTLSKESVKILAETTAQKENGIDTATIELSKATVELDHKTLETLAEQAKGTQIQLVVADKKRETLNTAQKTTLDQCQVATTFEAYFTSDGQRIHDFKGGKAVVSIDFTPEAGKDASYYHLVYVAESGEMTRYKTKYEKGRLMFTTTHFSDYAVIYDVNNKNETEEQPQEGDKKDDDSDSDVKVTPDTSFGRLRLRIPSSTKTTNVLKWTKQSGADGYVIYGCKCNTGKQTYKMVQKAVIHNGSATTWTDKNLTGATYYKYYIKAYKLVDGKKVWLAKSKVVHSTTTGGRYGNAKTVKINRTAVSLAVGKTFSVKAEQVVKDFPIKKHVQIQYESSNRKVASVSSKGVIRAKCKGTCYIYVYAQNGMYKRIKVTVK